MGLRYIVVGDIHGDYDALRRTLDKVNFNPTEDCFIGLGDYFDRGDKNIEVFEFLKSLPNKMLVMGNHDVYLYRCLRDCIISHYDISNRTTQTICKFAGEKNIEQSEHLLSLGLGYDIFLKASKLNILNFYRENMKWYFETPHYIFTHGWLPMTHAGKIAANLDSISDKRWINASQGRSVDEMEAFMSRYPEGCGKTIVVGHWYADDLKYKLHNDESRKDYNNWTGEKFVDEQHKIIGLDSATALTHFCDCLVIPEDEI